MRVWTGLFRPYRTSRKQRISQVVREPAAPEHGEGIDAIMHEVVWAYGGYGNMVIERSRRSKRGRKKGIAYIPG